MENKQDQQTKKYNFDAASFFDGEVKERRLIPDGIYKCEAIRGELFESKNKKTPGYKITFKITEGEYTDEAVWYDIYNTEKNARRRKEDLSKLQINTPEQIENFPRDNYFNVKITQWTPAEKTFNKVEDFSFIEHKPDPFELEAMGGE